MSTEYLLTNLGKAQYNNLALNAVHYGNSTTINNLGDFKAYSKTVSNPISIRMHESQQLEPKEKPKMATKVKRGLYQVLLIDPKAGKIIFNEFVICSKPEDVLLEADAGKIIKEKGLQVSEVDKIINLLGEIRVTKKNKDGVVELVEEATE